METDYSQHFCKGGDVWKSICAECKVIEGIMDRLESKIEIPKSEMKFVSLVELREMGCPEDEIEKISIKSHRYYYSTDEKYKEETDKIFSKLLISHDEVLDNREKELKEKEEYYRELDNVNTELKEKIKDIDNQMGRIFRQYETEKNPSEEEKEILGKVWEFIINEIPETFKIPLTKYERKKHLSLKMERHKEALHKLREERREITAVKRNGSAVKDDLDGKAVSK